ncbi:hypothetical protein LguiA_026328 [Lonicera macranthoides]
MNTQIVLRVVFISWLMIKSSAQLVCVVHGTKVNKTLMTKPGCPYRCEGDSGTVIPYPFGIGADCAHDESFVITCLNSTGMVIPYIKKLVLVLLEVIVDDSQVRVSNPEVTPLDTNFTGTTFRYQNFSTVTAVLKWGMHGNCSGTSSCGINAWCRKGEYYNEIQCFCPDGYEGNPYVQCQDINECADPSLNHCSMGCENYLGGYRCICDPGYELNSNSLYICRNTSNNSKYKANVIIGTCTGLGTMLLLLGLWWMYKLLRKRKKMKLRQKFFKRNGGLLLQQQLSSGEDGNIEKTRLFSSKELEMATDHYNENRVLGHGGQGTVYKGMLIDGRIVAVKKSTKVDEGQLDQFINEVAILSQINHRNIVKLHGCCLETEVPLLVYEFIPNGTLLQYIHDESEDFPLTWDVRLRIATEVAAALSYLHSFASFPIYHRDIKSTNILLDDKYRSKVADFGTSRSIAVDQTHLTTRVLGTFGYLDPEYFQSSQFTEKSDVYSFAIVLVELLTGQKPISSTRSDEMRSLATYFILAMEEKRTFDILDSRVRNEGKKDEIMRVANLARRCLNLNGQQRPTMKEVAMELEAIKISNGASIIQQHYEEFRLLENVDMNSIKAKLEDGVLIISINKLSPDHIKGPKVVSIGAGGEKGSLPVVENSAIHDPEVAHALITYMALPKDRNLLQHESSANLGMGAFRCLAEAGLRFLELELKQALSAIEVERRAKESSELLAKGVVAELKKVREEHSSAIALLNEVHVSEKSQLASQHESALFDERSGSYNEALVDSAREVLKLKDIIYQGGYKFGLTHAGIPSDHELFSQPALCPHSLYITAVSSDSEDKGKSDEVGPSSPIPKA